MRSRKNYRPGTMAMLALLGLAAVVLSGCAGESTKQAATSSSSEAPTPIQPTEAPTPSAPTAEMPWRVPESCEELIPMAAIQSINSELELYTQGEQAEAQIVEMLGAKTMEALMSGQKSIYCGWGISNSDAFAVGAAATISDSVKKDLLEALRDSVYTESSSASGAEAVFTRLPSSEHKHTSDVILDGNFLIAVSHSISGDFAQIAYRNLQRQ